MKKILFTLTTMLLVANYSNAQENSNNFKKWEIRVRALSVLPDEKVSIGTIGGDVSISDRLVPELDITYFFTKNIAAELILGTTKHNVKTEGSDLSAIGGPTSTSVHLGSVYLLPPTLTVQYHFLTADANIFRPYAGAGINYTIFYNEKAGNVVRGISYDNSFGLALQAGFDIKITDTFFANVDVKKIFMNTDVTVDASNLASGLSIPADVDINPWLLGVGIGMKF